MSKRHDLILDNLFSRSLFDEPIFGDIGLNSMIPSMRMDIKETETNYVVFADVPGVAKENINVDVEDGYLIISVKSSTEENKEDGKWIRRERCRLSQVQKLYVGEVNENDITASVKDGVLTINIPKKEEVKPEKKKIIIN